MFKFAIVCALLIGSTFAGLPTELMELMVQVHGTCIAESHVDPAVVEAAHKKQFHDDDKFKCYVKCMMVHLNAMSGDGVFQYDAVAAMIPEELKSKGAVAILDKCHGESGVDPCDTAYKIIRCVADQSQALAELFE